MGSTSLPRWNAAPVAGRVHGPHPGHDPRHRRARQALRVRHRARRFRDAGDAICPKCGGIVKENYKKFACQSCDWSAWKIVAGRQFEIDEIEPCSPPGGGSAAGLPQQDGAALQRRDPPPTTKAARVRFRPAEGGRGCRTGRFSGRKRSAPARSAPRGLRTRSGLRLREVGGAGQIPAISAPARSSCSNPSNGSRCTSSSNGPYRTAQGFVSSRTKRKFSAFLVRATTARSASSSRRRNPRRRPPRSPQQEGGGRVGLAIRRRKKMPAVSAGIIVSGQDAPADWLRRRRQRSRGIRRDRRRRCRGRSGVVEGRRRPDRHRLNSATHARRSSVTAISATRRTAVFRAGCKVPDRDGSGSPRRSSTGSPQLRASNQWPPRGRSGNAPVRRGPARCRGRWPLRKSAA